MNKGVNVFKKKKKKTSKLQQMYGDPCIWLKQPKFQQNHWFCREQIWMLYLLWQPEPKEIIQTQKVKHISFSRRI